MARLFLITLIACALCADAHASQASRRTPVVAAAEENRTVRLPGSPSSIRETSVNGPAARTSSSTTLAAAIERNEPESSGWRTTRIRRAIGRPPPVTRTSKGHG